jgi:hypothetical protein
LLPKDKQAPKELKVTDKRIFTPEGDIREEFKNDITPADPAAGAAAPPPQPPREEKPAEAPREVTPRTEAPRTAAPRTEERRQRNDPPPASGDRRSVADKGTNPGSPFTNFIEGLIVQGYMSLGMLRNPYQPQAKIDTAAARQMIDILTLLREKTSGNLTPDEEDFLETHLGELKLAFVQRTKSI